MVSSPEVIRQTQDNRLRRAESQGPGRPRPEEVVRTGGWSTRRHWACPGDPVDVDHLLAARSRLSGTEPEIEGSAGKGQLCTF